MYTKIPSADSLADLHGPAFLVTPYNHSDADIRWARAQNASEIAAILIRHGLPTISPIAHGYAIVRSKYGAKIEHDYETWLMVNRAIIRGCRTVLVYDPQDGSLQSSKGCADEVVFAQSMSSNPLIRILTPDFVSKLIKHLS